jgi:hypothetical protein
MSANYTYIQLLPFFFTPFYARLIVYTIYLDAHNVHFIQFSFTVNSSIGKGL